MIETFLRAFYATMIDGAERRLGIDGASVVVSFEKDVEVYSTNDPDEAPAIADIVVVSTNRYDTACDVQEELVGRRYDCDLRCYDNGLYELTVYMDGDL